MPNTQDMNMQCIQDTTFLCGHSSVPSQYAISALDDKGNVLNNCAINLVAQGYLWGSGIVWGASGLTWQSAAYTSRIQAVPWTAPVVFKRLEMQITAPASSGVAIGEIAMRYQKLNYTLAVTS